jgi:hypothetical protein
MGRVTSNTIETPSEQYEARLKNLLLGFSIHNFSGPFEGFQYEKLRKAGRFRFKISEVCLPISDLTVVFCSLSSECFKSSSLAG